MSRCDRLAALMLLVTTALVVAPAALAGERTLLLRTTEDASVPADPAACPVVPNLRLGATVWSNQTRASDGQVANDQARQVGTAAACGLITAPLVPSTTPRFYIEFTLEDGVYAADGTCTVISNDVPVRGLILAGCTLKVVGAPAGVLGGAATSTSVFNPLGLEGFGTGSFWTLRLYDAE